jgi:hypothetical protein
MGLKEVAVLIPKKRAGCHFSILGLILNFLLQRYMLLRPSFERNCDFNPKKKKKKHVLLLVPIFNSGVDFKVFLLATL